MKDKTTLTGRLSDLVDKAKEALTEEENFLHSEGESSLNSKRKNKILKTIAEEKKSVKNETLVKKPEIKNQKPKTVTHVEDENLKLVRARKLQMMTNTNREQAGSSPLQMHLVQSESLKIAQEKLSDLEDEIMSLREKNEALVSAGEVLKDNNLALKTKLEELKAGLNDEKEGFKEEKDVLLSAMEEARDQILSLRSKNQELEKRVSSNFHGIRQRENSLEGRIEILKMESSALQREKDKKILELKKSILKLKSNLESSHKKNHELSALNGKLKASSRRAVSALRATIYNLEGAKLNEETIVSQSEKIKKTA